MVFVLVALAIYRLAYLVTAEDGPFAIFSNWRHFLRGREILRGKSAWWIDGFFCINCASFWLGWLGALFVPFTSVWEYAIIALALGATTVLLKKALG